MPVSEPSPRVASRRSRLPLRLLVCAWLALLSAVAAAAEPGRYELDPVHTRVLFLIDHAGFSRALGTFSGSTGTLVFDPDDWTGARLEVVLPLERLALGDGDWNDAALDMLGADRYPQARFVSTRIEPVAADAAHVCGDLTLHGVTGELCLDVQLNQLRRYPLPPFRRTAGFSGSGQLRRSDFGIDRWAGLVGDVVELRIEAEAVYRGRAEVAPEPATPQPAAPADDDDDGRNDDPDDNLDDNPDNDFDDDASGDAPDSPPQPGATA